MIYDEHYYSRALHDFFHRLLDFSSKNKFEHFLKVRKLFIDIRKK